MTKTEIICLTPTSEDVDEMSRLLAPIIAEETNGTGANVTTTTTQAPTTTSMPTKKRVYPGNRGAFFEMFNSTTGYNYNNRRLHVRSINRLGGGTEGKESAVAASKLAFNDK